MARGSRLGFRPSFWPTLTSVPALALLLGLGTWQLQRLEWKEALIARLDSRLAAPVMALPARFADLDLLEYRRARVTGRFLHDREMYLLGHSPQGSAGFYVVTPLMRAHGPPVLVNRGWVPPALKDPARRPQSRPSAEVMVEGVIRKPQTAGWFTPANEPHKNQWFVLVPSEMGRAAGLKEVAPVYLQATAVEGRAGYPAGLPGQVTLRNPHLQYALTWYALALALVVIYVLYHRGRARQGPK
ncbi:MAG: SURF1 family protein [Kiloniellales bacterium]